MARRSYGLVTSVALASALLAGEVFAQTTPPSAATDAPKPSAPAGLTINFGDTSMKFGILLQPQADWSQDQTGAYAQNLGLRRLRFNVAGNVTKNVYFFIQTENARLGFATTTTNSSGTTTTTKSISTGFQILDAVAEWRIAKEFNLWGGMIYVPTSREALKSSTSEFMIDVSAFVFTATTALTGSGGRDTGFLTRGYFLDDRLEYRVGAFSGLRDTGTHNSYRYVGRVQYNFFDKEVYNLPAYTGSNLGTKKILAVGAAFDTQMHYSGYTMDLFADIPMEFGSVVGMAVWQRLDGGSTSAALAKSNILQLEAGAYFKEVKFGPWARYEQRIFSNAADKRNGDKRLLVGLNYYIKGHNANVKVAYGHVIPEKSVYAGGDVIPPTFKGTNQFVLQLQAYY